MMGMWSFWAAGVNRFLNDHPDAYHILLVDNIENRVRFMQKNYDLSHNRAVQVVKNEDKRRINLYRKLQKTDYDNPILYHLVLNMGKVNLEKALELINNLVNA